MGERGRGRRYDIYVGDNEVCEFQMVVGEVCIWSSWKNIGILSGEDGTKGIRGDVGVVSKVREWRGVTEVRGGWDTGTCSTGDPRGNELRGLSVGVGGLRGCMGESGVTEVRGKVGSDTNNELVEQWHVERDPSFL